MKKRLTLIFAAVVLSLLAVIVFPVRVSCAEEVTVALVLDGEEYGRLSVGVGEAASEPQPPKKEGYRFAGWYADAELTEPFEWGSPIYEDATVYASLELLPPSFEIDSLEFTFDSKSRVLSFRSVTHPLLSSGFLTYEWFKDGEELGYAGDELELREVKDSGNYSCKLTFSVAGASASVMTPDVSVRINKCELPLPEIPDEYYTGEPIYPQIFDTGTYTVQKEPKILAGTYLVSITLRDGENYSLCGTEGGVAYIPFNILPAENFWTVSPGVSDVYFSKEISPTAHSRFGEAVFTFAPLGGEYSSSIPTAPGKYLMIAEVAKTDNYSALKSEPIEFEIYEELISGVRILTQPTKHEYAAFEQFDPSGMELLVSYNSGRSEVVPGGLAEIVYLSSDRFLFGDGGVIVNYMGVSTLAEVRVYKADYDLSGISLPDLSVEFSGEVPPMSYEGVLPVGMDGIPLSAQLVGAGSAVGKYTVELKFSTESKNYNTPTPLQATLTVFARGVTVKWEGTSFVYDGRQKLPSASYTDVFGEVHPLAVSGGRTYAGRYTATATLPDSNYKLLNPSVEFEILKAEYDTSSVKWYGGGQIYDGKGHSVGLEGLPEGVSVVGYVDNEATNAGKYIAKAVFSYDSNNYNPPSVPDYEWHIYKASYPVSYSFPEAVVEFDGEAHTVAIVGEMPTGLDGISLEYELEGEARHVADGRVPVTVSFKSASTNYEVPSHIVTYISISPKYISVEWHNLEFRYTGATFSPYATAAECEIAVSGGKADAGEYSATAVPVTTDYALINPECAFVILKAENEWLRAPTVSSAFFGAPLYPDATVKGGTVEFIYYKSADCIAPLDSQPTEVGTYFMVAHSEGNGNYLPITSESVAFEIIAILPIKLAVTLLRTELFAFDTVEFCAEALNNDGSLTKLSESDVEVIYQSADSLRFGDGAVIFRYKELEATASVSVKKRSFDTSAIKWTPSDFTYDGNARSIELTGLPEGLSVAGYEGNGQIAAGEYRVTPILSYDGQNYEAPVVEQGALIIKKQIVPIPEIPSKFYTGSSLSPDVPESILYSFTYASNMRSAGVYKIVFSPLDPDNYELSSTEGYFVIEKRPISIRVNDTKHYVFDPSIDFSFTVTEGEIAAGDVIGASYTVEDNKISAVFDNPNYSYNVTEGELERVYAPSPEQMPTVLIFIFIILFVILIITLLITQRQRIIIACTGDGSDGGDEPPTPPTTPTPPESPTDTSEPTAPTSIGEDDGQDGEEGEDAPFDDEPLPSSTEEEQGAREQPTLPVSAEYADAAISNSLARDLIRRDESVVTDGKRRGIVNVDTLSRSFSSGDRVDINALKNHSLIPYDTAYIKVLARGVIDKPLFVYANDFSLAAVKMIALTGGRAVKVATEIKK